MPLMHFGGSTYWLSLLLKTEELRSVREAVLDIHRLWAELGLVNSDGAKRVVLMLVHPIVSLSPLFLLYQL